MKNKSIKLLLVFSIILILFVSVYNCLFVRIQEDFVFRFTHEYHTPPHSKNEDLKNVRKLKQIDQLYIDLSEDITDIDFVSDYSKITLISINPANSDFNLDSISKFTNLETLYLSGKAISDVQFLKGCTNLKTLHLSECKVTDITGISECSTLESIYIYSGGDYIKGLEELSELPNLHHLSISNASKYDMESISKIITLETLSILENRDPVDLSCLSGMKHLESLYIPIRNVLNAESLLNNPSLKKVTILKGVIDDDIKRTLQLNGIEIIYYDHR